MSKNDICGLLDSGDIKQLKIGIDCPKCGYDKCTILEPCILMRGNAIVGISLGYACMRCAEINERYVTFNDVANEAAKIDFIDSSGISGEKLVGDVDGAEISGNKETVH